VGGTAVGSSVGGGGASVAAGVAAPPQALRIKADNTSRLTKVNWRDLRIVLTPPLVETNGLPVLRNLRGMASR
jgi:hypothetical protein